ncbi:aldo/keto reductase [Novosphingobium sp. MD-1]|uniref:aldo/keto reductase n=1 Tax=Novosphingobium sp. MD-1 TaxID=1630648 RepID=UPI000F7DE672|nr:aldo/keto reductase [Novosphingobium sp. MD-1]
MSTKPSSTVTSTRTRGCVFRKGGSVAGESLAKRRVPASVSAMLQVALTWLLARSPNLLLIPGTSSTAHLAENCGAAELTLTEEAKAPLDALAG